MNIVAFVIATVLGFMLAENRLSRANEGKLREAGAVEPPGDVFRPLAVLYPAAFLLMGFEGAWRASRGLVDTGGPSWFASGAVLFVASKALNDWAIRSLGERWSFRVLIQPGRPLVGTGPYRYVAHPNYIAVVGELLSTAMMMRAAVMGPLMIGAFGVALVARMRFEERALSAARGITHAGKRN